MVENLQDLTEREKETLRLIVRGHDAKSMASELGLSVHTINERLRVARRKLGVTSSREAARLLFEREGWTNEKFVYEESARPSVAVRFSTRFANRAQAVETITLEQEHGDWKVMGYTIE